MKKLFLTAAAVFAFGFANAQEGSFKGGAHVGLPMGDAGDVYSLNLGLDLAYTWNVSDKFDAGLTTGYSMFMGKSESVSFGGITTTVDYGDAGFIPLAATGQYKVTDNLFLGADLGYAIYAGEGDGNGGMYYQPKFGYSADKYEVYLGYKGISADGGSTNSLNLGFNYKF